MIYYCHYCDEILSRNGTEKTGHGMETRRWCGKCHSKVTSCASVMRSGLVKVSQDFIGTANCDKCYSRFRCLTGER